MNINEIFDNLVESFSGSPYLGIKTQTQPNVTYLSLVGSNVIYYIAS